MFISWLIVAPPVVLLVGLVVAWFANRAAEQRVSAVWAEAEELLGFECRTTHQLVGYERHAPHRLVGSIDGIDLEIEAGARHPLHHPRKSVPFRVSTSAGGAIPAGLRVATRLGLERTRKTSGFGEYEVGDPAFDDVVEVAGEPVVISAVLDSKLRSALRGALVASTAISGRKIVWWSDTPPRSPQGFEKAAKAVVRLATLMARHADKSISERLLATFRSDPVAAVRLRCFTALIEQHGDFAKANGVLSDAAADDEPEIRGAAFALLGKGEPERLEEPPVFAVDGLSVYAEAVEPDGGPA